MPESAIPQGGMKDDLLFTSSPSLNPAIEIPLNLINTPSQLEYVSALAFQRFQARTVSPLSLAEQIQRHLVNQQRQSGSIDAVPEKIWRSFLITVAEPGWIHLRLVDQGLATWLQWAIDLPWHTHELASSSQLDNVKNATTQDASVQGTRDRHSVMSFEILHAYARCNSLLRLGQDQFLQFEEEQDWSSLNLRPSHSIPWLDAEQTFQAQQPQDWALLHQLSQAIDYLASSTAASQATLFPEKPAWKTAHRLSQSFQHFHAACRIWGMAESDKPLAQARLGLVLLTRKVLQVLIQARLHLTSSMEF